MKYPSKEVVEALRREFPAGCLIKLVRMKNEPQAPPIGTIGRVIGVDDLGTIHTAWETGSTLGVAYGEDCAVRID